MSKENSESFTWYEYFIGWEVNCEQGDFKQKVVRAELSVVTVQFMKQEGVSALFSFVIGC